VSDHAALTRLAEQAGIESAYQDIWGRRHGISDNTRRALLAAMHLDPQTDPARLAEQREAAQWQRPLAPVQVHPAGAPLTVTVTLADGAPTQRWRLTLENGARHAGEFDPTASVPLAERRCGDTLYRRHELALPAVDDIGYHLFELEPADADDRPVARLRLIGVPTTCFQPEAVRDAHRLWGPAVQLYGLRSARNWGIGDFTDLRALIALTAEAGGGLVGINPLHALFPDQPGQCSPYSPSSRQFLNVLYLDVDAVIDANDAAAVRAQVAQARFQARLQELRDAELVDYEAVAAVKLDVLRQTWRAFGDQHLGSDSPRPPSSGFAPPAASGCTGTRCSRRCRRTSTPPTRRYGAGRPGRRSTTTPTARRCAVSPANRPTRWRSTPTCSGWPTSSWPPPAPNPGTAASASACTRTWRSV
jgi:(1->4)-alpha-D-glucan 1-alpha-D-glucosylmutase